LDDDIGAEAEAFKEKHDLTWAQVLLKGAELPYKE
jgi:hypothetical protein